MKKLNCKAVVVFLSVLYLLVSCTFVDNSMEKEPTISATINLNNTSNIGVEEQSVNVTITLGMITTSNSTPVRQLTPSISAQLVQSPASSLILPTSVVSTMIVTSITSESACSEPCIFNIELGETNWSAIKAQLSQLGEVYQSTSGRRFFAELNQKSLNETYDLKHFFEVENDTIISLEADVKFKDEFELPAILSTYGVPDEIWIRTFKDKRGGILPFRVYLIYEEKAMLLLYGFHGERVGNHVNGCLDTNEHNTSTIVLLLPKIDETINFEEATKLRSRLNNQEKAQRLEEVSEMSLEEFHDTFIGADNGQKCIMTEAKYWTND